MSGSQRRSEVQERTAERQVISDVAQRTVDFADRTLDEKSREH